MVTSTLQITGYFNVRKVVESENGKHSGELAFIAYMVALGTHEIKNETGFHRLGIATVAMAGSQALFNGDVKTFDADA